MPARACAADGGGRLTDIAAARACDRFCVWFCSIRRGFEVYRQVGTTLTADALLQLPAARSAV